MACSVCCEQTNLSTRKNIKCNYCNYECCIKCSKRYMLESYQDAHCMNCRKPLLLDFLNENFTKTFISGEYKKHREDILLQRELMLLPETQPFIERENKIKNLNTEIQDLTSRLKDVKMQLAEVKYGNGKLISDKFKVSYVARCCKDGCNGFVNTDYTCGICETKICKECYVMLKDEHTCKTEDIDTVKLIKKDSKPCPNCAVPIFKISGCDNMFCMECKVGFCWRTGKLFTNTLQIHNPHYFEWMANRTDNVIVNQNPCDGIIRFEVIVPIIRKSTHKEFITQVFQKLQHFRFVNLNNRNDNVNQKNLDLRIKYLNKDITKGRFKLIIQQREKAEKKKRSIYDVYQLLYNAGMDLIRVLIQDKNIEKFVHDIRELSVFAAEGFEKCRLNYGGVVPIINIDTFEIK